VVDRVVTTDLVSPLIDFLVSEEAEPPLTVNILQDSDGEAEFKIEASQ